MAYQNVGTPRFYINVLEWLSVNKVQIFDTRFYTLPVDTRNTVDSGELNNLSSSYFYNDNNFIALLGHTLTTTFAPQGVTSTAVVNYPEWSDEAPYNGFSIATFIGTPLNIWFYGATHNNIIGSTIVGTYYDMPHGPDLSLTMSREMDGVKKLRTKGGNDLVDYKYKRSPNWGYVAPWELYDWDTINWTLRNLARYGRRVWDLSFSYLAAKDVMGAPEFIQQGLYTDSIDGAGNSGGTVLTGLGWDSDDVDDDSFAYNLLDHDDFYSQVIHKTGGGRLPFIFQPNKNDNTTFAICKFDMNTFSFEQVANGIYNVKLKIREVW